MVGQAGLRASACPGEPVVPGSIELGFAVVEPYLVGGLGVLPVDTGCLANSLAETGRQTRKGNDGPINVGSNRGSHRAEVAQGTPEPLLWLSCMLYRRQQPRPSGGPPQWGGRAGASGPTAPYS